MRNPVIHLFSVILIFSGLSCYPQDSMFLSGAQRSFRIMFDRSEAPSSVIANEMLKEISADAVKNIRNTGFILNYGIEININYSSRKSGYEILFHRNGTGGDHSYRGFSLEGVLFPDSIGGEITIIRKGRGPFFSGRVQMNADTAHPDALRISGDLPAFDPKTDSLATESLAVLFTASCLDSFQKRISLINDYYACSFVTDTLLIMEYDMDPPQTINMARLFIFLEEACKFLVIAQQRDLNNILELERTDPLNFREHYMELYRFTKSAMMTFRERLDNGSFSGQEALTAGSFDDLMRLLLRYIRWSFQVNERNSSIYHELLDRFWSLNAFEKDTVLIRQLLSGVYPGMDIDSLLREFSGRIRGAYRHYAETLADSGRNAEALELLNNQRLFSADNPWLRQEDEDETTRILAVRGIYTSYLSVASSAMANQKLTLAETYLKKALKFKAENLLPGPPDSLYREIYNRFLSLRVPDYDTLSLSDSILSAESLIWNNRFAEAEKFADSIEHLIGAGKTGGDSMAIRAIQKYRALITQKICWNLDESISVLKIRAERARELKNYSVLCILLDSAVTLSESHPGCGPGSKELKDTLSRYSVACAYNRMLDDAWNSVVLNHFDDAVKKYYDLAESYKTNRIGSYGIGETSLEEIIRQRSLPLLTLAAGRFYEGKHQYGMALGYLKILRLQDYPVREIKPYLAALARKMAQEDFVKDPMVDPNATVNRYIDSDKWFARFRSAYLYEWNTLRNSGSP